MKKSILLIVFLASSINSSFALEPSKVNKTTSTIKTMGVIPDIGSGVASFLFENIKGTDFAVNLCKSLGIPPLASINQLFKTTMANLKDVEAKTDRIYGALSNLEQQYTRNTYYDSQNSLASILGNVDITYKKVDNLFSSQGFETVSSFDNLKLVVPVSEHDNLISQLATYSSVNQLENIANTLSDTMTNNTPIVAMVQNTFLYSYWNNFYNSLVSNNYIKPWENISNTSYQSYSGNAVLIKANYYAIINLQSLQILTTLQQIASLLEYYTYLNIIKHEYKVVIPSFIRIDPNLDDVTNYNNAINTIQNEFKLKADSVIALADYTKKLYKLPIVGSSESNTSSLPSNCIEPNNIPDYYSESEITSLGLFWSGFGGKNTGKLVTMCKNNSGSYVPTFPIYLGVPGNENNNENKFCPYMINKELNGKEFLFCNSASAFPLTFTTVDALFKNLHIDSAHEGSTFNRIDKYTFTEENFEQIKNSIASLNPQWFNSYNKDDVAKNTIKKDHYLMFQTAVTNFSRDSLNNLSYTIFQTLPFIISFTDQNQQTHYCPITLDYYQARAVMPALTPINVKAESYRCGENGQFQVEYNGSYAYTININDYVAK